MSTHALPLRLDAYTRRLGPVADPAALVAAFAPSARGGSSALLATEDGASIVILSALARVTGRGRSISVEVLEPTARPLLEPLAAALAPRGMVRRAGAALTFEPATPDPWLDEEARLLAPGPLDALRALVLGSSVLACDEPAQRLAVGLLGYDLVDAYEGLPAPRVASAHPTLDLLLPELLLSVAPGGRDATLTALVPRDADREVHARALGRLVAAERLAGLPAAPPAPAAPVEARADLDDDAYAALVERMQAHVRAGDVFQIVPARAFRAPCPDPLAAFRRLAALNPSRYAFCLTAPERTLFGCSPETAVAVDGRTRTARLTPIAGTRPRARGADGALDAELDARLLAELHLDPKELAEHVMLVDLARNDLARVSEPGTRRVVELFRAVKSSHVMHLVSEVEGRLRDGLDALHAYAACLNMGTLTGAPKLRAMELLREHEPEARGFYGGGFGALRGDGSLDTAIVIRSAEVARGVATVRAGAGVVLDSIPAREAEETRRKAQAVLAALGAKEAS